MPTEYEYDLECDEIDEHLTLKEKMNKEKRKEIWLQNHLTILSSVEHGFQTLERGMKNMEIINDSYKKLYFLNAKDALGEKEE